jgi:hypothetical protein
MSNRRRTDNSHLQRGHWRPSPHRVAAAVAATGEPTPLLALETYVLRNHPSSVAMGLRRVARSCDEPRPATVSSVGCSRSTLGCRAT